MTTQSAAGFQPSDGPHTNAALWLREVMRGVPDAQRQPRLNQGEKGWNDDEPSVIEAACELAARQYFGKPGWRASRRIRRLAKELHGKLAGQIRPLPSRLELDAILRSALDESFVLSAQLRVARSRGMQFGLRVAVTCNIAIDLLELDASAIDQLLIEAERVAVARGFHPALREQQTQQPAP